MKLLEQIITDENIQELGEIIAIRAVKTVASRSMGKLDHLYKGLLHDVYKRNTEGHTISDGYDYAHIAMLFLLNFRGHYLGEYCCTNYSGEPCSILYACYHIVNTELCKQRRIMRQTECLADDYRLYALNDYDEQDYTIYDIIMAKLDLKQFEIETIDCYMSGMTCLEIAAFLNIERTTLWKRRQRIKKKHLTILGK